MPLTVLQRPNTPSVFNAAGNPIVYKFQRKDFVFNQVNNNGGFVQIQINGSDVTGSFANSNSLYVKSDNDVYDSFGMQTAEAFSGGNTLITTDIPYTAVAPGGFVNNITLKPLYRVEVEIYNLNNQLINAAFEYSTTAKGFVLVDVSETVLSRLSPVNDLDLTGTTKVFDDTNAYYGAYIKYREVWTGSSEAQVNDSFIFYGVIGAMQIPSSNGGNMDEYVSPLPGGALSKFLSKFSNLKMWRGYPFLVGFISPNDGFLELFLEVDGASQTTQANFENKVIVFDLNQILPDQTLDQVEIQVMADDTPPELSELKTVTLVDSCRNPVMLLGRNSLGGPLQWLFDSSQEYSFDYGGGRKAKRLVLTADRLTINEWESLQDFITLGEVYRENIVEFTSATNATSRRIGQQVYVLNPDGSKIGVIVIPTRNTTLTRRVRHTFELEIEFPEVFSV